MNQKNTDSNNINKSAQQDVKYIDESSKSFLNSVSNSSDLI